jgi:hypothetical protein
MSKCLDCGCNMDAGICPNCHEALYIQTYQSDSMVQPVSPEFIAEVNQESQAVKQRNKIIREDPAVFKDLKPTDDYYKAKS